MPRGKSLGFRDGRGSRSECGHSTCQGPDVERGESVKTGRDRLATAISAARTSRGRPVPPDVDDHERAHFELHTPCAVVHEHLDVAHAEAHRTACEVLRGEQVRPGERLPGIAKHSGA